MNRELDAESVGEQLGVEGVQSVVSKVEAYCAYEERRIELTNQPRILGLRQEGSLLLEEERDLMERLRHAPPPGDLRSRRRRTVYYWGITVVLTIAAFVFSVLSFDPFRVGWKGYLYCLGIAVVTPFLLEQLLENWNNKRLFKGIATMACAAALTSLVLLAVIRGDLFAEQMKNTAPVITFDDAQSQPQPTEQNDFFDATIGFLRITMALLAVAMELGAGLALYEAWRMGNQSSEDWELLRTRLKQLRQRMSGIAEEITALQNESAIFAARFWQNFYRAMLTHSVRSGMSKLRGILLVAFVFALAHGRALAQEHALVIALDLTQSTNVAGPEHKTGFAKNVEGVTYLLAQIPASSRVTVIGITDKSFTQPDILLSATIPDDPGYFGERLKSAQSQLVRTWKTRSAKLTPNFRETDILGALMLASEIFEERAIQTDKVLVIVSDMRQQTRELDLESPSNLLRLDGPEGNEARIGITHLGGVRVYAVGVDGTGKPSLYWQSLRRFWTGYFAAAGATLGRYTVTRSGLCIICSDSR